MNSSVVDRSNDLLHSVRLHSKSVSEVLNDTSSRVDSGLLHSEYVNLPRLPDKVEVVTDALASELLDPHVVQLASSGDIVASSGNPQYYDEDILEHGLTDDDKKLAAALVAVQFVQHQKHHQNSLLATDLLGGKPLHLSHFASAIDKSGMGIVSNYVHPFEDAAQNLLDSSSPERNSSTSPLVAVEMDHKLAKSLRDSIDTSSEEHGIDEIETSLKSSRRSLPHKKRIARKLKTQSPKNINMHFFKCIKCGDEFSNQLDYFNHRAQHANQSKKVGFSCEICDSQFTNQIKFFQHLKGHYEPKINSETSDLQSDIFSCTEDLQSNNIESSSKTSCLQARKNSNEPCFRCEICGRLFKRQKAYESHKATVHINTEEFSEPEDMMEGIRHVVNSQTTSCDDDSEEKLRSWRLSDDLGINSDCGTTNSEIFDDSTENEKNKNKKVVQCPHCEKVFGHRNSLIYHIKSHSGMRPHQCDVCGKRFFAANALRVHMRLHSGDKPYECKACGRRFRQWGDLKYHVTSLHSNQKQYQCEFCGKDFARKYSLTVHRRIHTGEKNYFCPYCHKTFRASSYLVNHMRIHTGEKPYSCDLCQKPFRVKSDMKRHRITHLKDRMLHDRIDDSVANGGTIPLQDASVLRDDGTPINLNMRNDSTDSLTYSRDAFDRESDTLYVWLPANGESILPDE